MALSRWDERLRSIRLVLELSVSRAAVVAVAGVVVAVAATINS